MQFIPYTYLIGWSGLDKWYYGVRYSRKSHPSDLWNPYKTSSKHVKRFIDEHGDPDVIQVRKTFETVSEARRWEHKVLSRMRVVSRDDFLNKTDNKSIDPDCALIGAKKSKPFKPDDPRFAINKGNGLNSKRSKDLDILREMSDVGLATIAKLVASDPEWTANRNESISQAKRGKPIPAIQTTSHCVGCRELVQPSRLKRAHRSCFKLFCETISDY